jgi:hypothetical protein
MLLWAVVGVVLIGVVLLDAFETIGGCQVKCVTFFTLAPAPRTESQTG